MQHEYECCLHSSVNATLVAGHGCQARHSAAASVHHSHEKTRHNFLALHNLKSVVINLTGNWHHLLTPVNKLLQTES